MPSRLKNRNAIPVDTLSLDGGDFVQVRRYMTAEDQDEINAKIATLNQDTGMPSLESGIVNRVTTMRALVAWGGPGFCVEEHAEGEEIPEDHQHTPVEINFESVSKLPAGDLRKIIQHVAQRNPRVVAPDPLGAASKAIGAGVS